ncbi:MAG TPA: undecaprenyldiphospho-muramoylpentapeptide beta-N-acetylglucosaminyltransferase [Spirochaetia bacterium]|nr:undecaprenyldiphospho-muramoylpentapeptide beta-N-acetylglucosaminyltransferase [Spirochaetia bacterium]
MTGQNSGLRVVVSGGGTGGHIYPALAIARGVVARGGEVLYIGTATGMEGDIVPRAGVPFAAVGSAGLSRSWSVHNVAALGRAGWGVVQAHAALRRFRPSVVAGTGGYVSAPVVLAACALRLPTLIHEQNAIPGLTNRWLGRLVDGVAVTFPAALPYFRHGRVKCTGLPVRPDILVADRVAARRNLGLDDEAFFLLSFGGSRGAKSLNQSMVEVIRALGGQPDLHLLHLTGQAGQAAFQAELDRRGINLANYGNVKVDAYRDQMADLLAAADLVIARAGAASIAELTVLGRPGILIPYPYAAGDHQVANAGELVAAGAARMILDRDLSGDRLLESIEELRRDRPLLGRMGRSAGELGRPRALDDILDFLEELTFGRS